MKLSLPKEGNTGESDNEGAKRLDRGRVSIRVMLIQTGKVSITPTLEVESSIGLEDHSFVLGALEVSDNHLESGGV